MGKEMVRLYLRSKLLKLVVDHDRGQVSDSFYCAEYRRLARYILASQVA